MGASGVENVRKCYTAEQLAENTGNSERKFAEALDKTFSEILV